MSSITQQEIETGALLRFTEFRQVVRHFQGRYYVTLPYLTEQQVPPDNYQSRVHSRSLFVYEGGRHGRLIHHSYSERRTHGHNILPPFGTPDRVRLSGVTYERPTI